MPILRAAIIKNSDILARKHFVFLERSRPNSKVFKYQIWTSVQSSKKWLSSKRSFSTFLQQSCSNFGLKCIKGLGVT